MNCSEASTMLSNGIISMRHYERTAERNCFYAPLWRSFENGVREDVTEEQAQFHGMFPPCDDSLAYGLAI
jgi:hypothetical protein